MKLSVIIILMCGIVLFFFPLQAVKIDQSSDIRPGLFILMFTITDFHSDLEQQLDVLFDKILNKNDQMIYLVNDQLIPQHVLKDPEAEKVKLKGFLKQASDKTDTFMDNLTKEMDKLLTSATLNTIGIEVTPEDHPEDLPQCLDASRDMLEKYSKYMQIYKTNYLYPDIKKVSNAVLNEKNKKYQKVTINFTQIEHLPKVAIFSRNLNEIKRIIKDSKSFELGACAVAAFGLEKEIVAFEKKYYSEYPAEEFGDFLGSSRAAMVSVWLDTRNYKNMKSELSAKLSQLSASSGGTLTSVKNLFESLLRVKRK